MAPPKPDELLLNRLEQVSVVLESIHTSAAPLGVRKATESLLAHGIPTSESTVSRLLRTLDQEGWTRPIGVKGRMLTRDGLIQLRKLQSFQRQQDTAPLDVRSLDDLRALLVARRAVERENVRAAATRLGTDELHRLRRITEQHKLAVEQGTIPRVVALTFHRFLGASTGNKFLSLMTDLVFDPHLDSTEAVLDIIVTQEHTEARSVNEHEEILDAIALGDADLAENLMQSHINRLIDQVDVFRAQNRTEVFDRLLQYVASLEETEQLRSSLNL